MRAKSWQNNSWVCMSLWWIDTNAGVKIVKMMNGPSKRRVGTNWVVSLQRRFAFGDCRVTPAEVPNGGYRGGLYLNSGNSPLLTSWLWVLHEKLSPHVNSVISAGNTVKALFMPWYHGGSRMQWQQALCSVFLFKHQLNSTLGFLNNWLKGRALN